MQQSIILPGATPCAKKRSPRWSAKAPGWWSEIGGSKTTDYGAGNGGGETPVVEPGAPTAVSSDGNGAGSVGMTTSFDEPPQPRTNIKQHPKTKRRIPPAFDNDEKIHEH